MKTLLSLLVVVAAGCATVQEARHEDKQNNRAQDLCESSAVAQGTRVTATETPISVGHEQYVIPMKTTGANGEVRRRCEVDLREGTGQVI